MKLPPEGARWLVSLRWLACGAVVLVIWLASSVLKVLGNPLPLYLVAAAMVGYNVLFYRACRRTSAGEGNVERNIFFQILFDLVSLTLLLYYADLPRNPFLFFFVFHMIIAGMYLRGRAPYFFAAMATTMVGGVMLLLYFGWIPPHPLHFPRTRPRRSRPTNSLCWACLRRSPARCGSRCTSPRRSGATSIGPMPSCGRRRRCWASASWWPALPTKSPTRWTACRIASRGSASASRTIRT